MSSSSSSAATLLSCSPINFSPWLLNLYVFYVTKWFGRFLLPSGCHSTNNLCHSFSANQYCSDVLFPRAFAIRYFYCIFYASIPRDFRSYSQLHASYIFVSNQLQKVLIIFLLFSIPVVPQDELLAGLTSFSWKSQSRYKITKNKKYRCVVVDAFASTSTCRGFESIVRFTF